LFVCVQTEGHGAGFLNGESLRIFGCRISNRRPGRTCAADRSEPPRTPAHELVESV
jgi:hypothetical protein